MSIPTPQRFFGLGWRHLTIFVCDVLRSGARFVYLLATPPRTLVFDARAASHALIPFNTSLSKRVANELRSTSTGGRPEIYDRTLGGVSAQ